jgi:hypothetical protein
MIVNIIVTIDTQINQENKQTYTVSNPRTCKNIIMKHPRREPRMNDVNSNNTIARNLSKKFRKCHMKQARITSMKISNMSI